MKEGDSEWSNHKYPNRDMIGAVAYHVVGTCPGTVYAFGSSSQKLRESSKSKLNTNQTDT